MEDLLYLTLHVLILIFFFLLGYYIGRQDEHKEILKLYVLYPKKEWAERLRELGKHN